MTFQPGGNLYTVAFGTRPENVEVPHYDTRVPTTSDILYPIGKEWIYVGQSIWKLLSISSVAGVTTANWIQLADSDGPVQSVVGTANQVTVTTVAGTATVSLPSAIITPGSLSTTTTLTAGTGLTVTSGGAAITGTTTINTTGAAVTTIGTGGTGAVNIGNATGNTAVTGSLTTSGNVIINGAATQLRVHGGAATDFIGTATLTAGTTGAIANTNIAATDRIFVQRTSANASTAVGVFSYTISAGASFTITALNPTDASTQTNDVSTVTYFIVRQV